MSTFADSSALVKLYANEEGYAQVRMLKAIIVSVLARVEVPSAIWRKQRLRELNAADARVLIDDFEADYFGTDAEPPRFAAVITTADVLDEATRLCAAHSLRAFDAIQLSSAIVARSADPTCATLAAFDSALRLAASREDFALIPE